MIEAKDEIMAEPTKPLLESKEEIRTSATVFEEDFQIFKSIATLKFSKDPLNNAWKEAIQLFVNKNRDLLKESYENLPK